MSQINELNAYVAGPLTDLRKRPQTLLEKFAELFYIIHMMILGKQIIYEDQVKKFYEDIGRMFEEIGITAFIPHKDFDPEKNKDAHANEVYEADAEHVIKANFMSAYMGAPSTGTGQEIEIAANNGTKVILLHEEDKRVSRMTLGNPNIAAVISFKNFEEGIAKLKKEIQNQLNAS